jgi:hypothetical protein
MTARMGYAAALTSGWPRTVARFATAVILAVLASCGGGDVCRSCAVDDLRSYRQTWIAVSPGVINVGPGEAASASVSVGGPRGLEATAYRDYRGVFVVPPTPGVTLTRTDEPCEVPPADPTLQHLPRSTYRLDVGAEAIAAGVRDVTLSAIWADQPILAPDIDPSNPARTIERVETFRIALTAPPPVVTPDFQVAVDTTASVYGTRATLPASITRTAGFAESVTLEFDGLSSGIAGTFAADPAPADRRTLQLQMPARHAGGGLVAMRVTARTPSGLSKVVNVSQYIEPLFKLIHAPQSAVLSTAAPLRVNVGLKAGEPFRSPSIGAVELSISPATPLPDGVTARFLDDPMPAVPVLRVETVSRILRLKTDGRPPGVEGSIRIRGSARDVPPDADGVAPFIEVTLNLRVDEGQFWSFAGNNLTYGFLNDADLIGFALQGDNRPAMAWLQRPGTSPGFVYLRRYDGTTFAASPPAPAAEPSRVPLLRPAGGIDKASFALTATDAGQVAFTFDGGARLALGRAERAAVEWSIAPPWTVGDRADPATPRARSPRVATGPVADLVVVSYIQEANAATTTGGVLHVLRTFGNGVLSELPTTLPGGALNASPTGSVVRHASALALGADGNPWVAWIEEPTNTAIPNRLWLRVYNGNDWGPAIAVPAPLPPVGPSVQLLAEPSGQVAVAWLEGSPAQLKLMRYDPASQFFTPLDDTGNGRGSLNVTVLSPALDMHLTRHPDGRLLVTWTEGGADPRVWIKRRDADGAWRLVGTTVGQVDRWSKTPRIASDTNHRLYVAWATYAAGQNPSTPRPYAEIDVAQRIFPCSTFCSKEDPT